MLITEKTLTTLEFDKILNELASATKTSGGASLALSLRPSDYKDEILRRQRKTSDAKKLIYSKTAPSFGDIRDINDSSEKAEKGAHLTPRELLDVAGVLRTTRLLIDYIRIDRLFETSLDEIFDRLIPNRSLEERITRSIISEDMIADEASSQLAEIRRKIRSGRNHVKEILQKYTSSNNYSKYLQENIVTVRNGRYVIPVKAENKNEIKGLVHDTSSSGSTLFIEPMAVVEANNELRVLESKEEHEIEKILYEMSVETASFASALRLDYMNIVELDFYFACAELSCRMNAEAVLINNDKKIIFNRARHPLISKERVVPIDVRVSDGFDTMIITGPNTGGKTVTLKTLGLFSLMVQSGLHIPVGDNSSVCVFDRILVDIGDEQSIEQSLSTFSSHMVNIVGIMGKLTENALVLFDELGVGTDPVEGAALAVSIIEAVRESGAICVATTHYAELKAYALNTKGVCNASCEFDIETLKPTYKLIIGTPGKSNAFAISQKLGISEKIIERAKQQINNENRKFENVIEKLEQKRIEMEHNKEETAKMKNEFRAYREKAELEIQKKLTESDKILAEASRKSSAMIESARASSEFIFEQIDKLRKEKDVDKAQSQLNEKRKLVREYLRSNEHKFNPVNEVTNEEYVLPRKLRKGDEVLIVSIGKNGFLLDNPDKSGNVSVQAGIIKTRLKIDDLQLIENDTTIIDKDNKKIKASNYTVSASRAVRPEIDLRGMMGDEGWLAVDKYIDEAIMAGLHNVSIIHGKGTGALRNAIWQRLRTDKRIASYRIGRYGEGDGGVTILELK